METVLREILSKVKEEKPDGKKIEEMQKAFDLAEDVERLAGKRGMVGVQEAIQDGYFPKDIKDADFFAKLLSVPFSQDLQISLLEIFLAKYTYDDPEGLDAFIDYIYYRTASVAQENPDLRMLSAHLCSLLPEEMQKNFHVCDFMRKSCFAEYEEKAVSDNPPCQELKDSSAISSRERLEKFLKRMDNRAIQRMLREVNNDNLGVALKGCQPEMAKVVLENLSKRLRTMILEDMDYMGSLRDMDIKQDMDGLSDLIAKLVEEKEIALLDEDGVK